MDQPVSGVGPSGLRTLHGRPYTSRHSVDSGHCSLQQVGVSRHATDPDGLAFSAREMPIPVGHSLAGTVNFPAGMLKRQ